MRCHLRVYSSPPGGTLTPHPLGTNVPVLLNVRTIFPDKATAIRRGIEEEKGMRRRGGFIGKALAVAAVMAIGALAAAPMHAAGFSVFEQGTKAMGMAGAFTAQADDPSMLFHNAGGLAFVTEQEVAGGFTYIRSSEADFQGAAPFPGPSVSASQKDLSEILPHAYWVRPLNDTWKIGLGLETPFGLTTEWENPSTFAGRFLSTKAALRAVDLNPTLGWKLSEQ